VQRRVKGKVKSVCIGSVDEIVNPADRIAKDLDVSTEEAVAIALLHYIELKDEVLKRVFREIMEKK